MLKSAIQLVILLLICLVISVSTSFAQQLKIIHINVGQGDATLIIGPTGTSMLFDAGPTGKGTKLRQILDANGVTALNYFVVGHYHADHIGSIDELIATGINVTTASYDRGGSYSSQTYTDYVNAVGTKRRTITLGQIIDLGGGVTAECVAVAGQTHNGTVTNASTDENALSVALVIRYGTFDYIIASDLTGGGTSGSTTKPDVETKVASYAGDIDVMHVGHHGSTTSTNQFWVDTLKAEQSVISLADGNSYGHPTQTILDRLNASANMLNIWQTQAGTGATANKVRVGGDITFVTNGSSYTITATGYNVTYPTDGITKNVNQNQGDFSLSTTPSSQSVPSSGTTTSYTVNISRIDGFASSVSLSVSGLPTGVTATFTPQSVSGNSSTLSLTVASSTPTGTYNLTITGTGGIPLLSRTTTVMLTKLAPAPDFSLSLNPSSQTVGTSGGTASYAVNISRINSFTSSISFAVSGLPTGVTANFNPSSTTSNTTTLTLTVASSTATGNYNFTVTGTGGSPTLTRTTIGTLVKSATNVTVVINEIAWGGSSSSPDDEWIELYNASGSTISLTGWRIVDDDGAQVYTLSGTIAAGGYYLIERNAQATSVTGNLVVSTMSLANTGDKLVLQNATGTNVDEVNLSGGAWYAGNDSSGTPTYATMERVSASVSGDLASNWKSNNGIVKTGKDSKNKVINGTPKIKNSATP
ncbi:MAG: lamin tail domain-containing protein [Blastocatellia bacterium]